MKYIGINFNKLVNKDKPSTSYKIKEDIAVIRKQK